MRPVHLAPELAAYQCEPQQLPAGSPGKVAQLRLGFEGRGSRTILADLFRRAPLIVHRAIYWDEEMPDMPCVFIISNSGGILQGDRHTISIEVGPFAQAHVTTQSATKIHEMDANYATQQQEIVLHDHAYLEILPDPTIPHRNTRFLTQTHIVIVPTATLLYSEILMAGRKYYARGQGSGVSSQKRITEGTENLENQASEHPVAGFRPLTPGFFPLPSESTPDGELYEYDLYSSTVRAKRPEGDELFVEKFVIRPRQRPVRLIGMMGDFDVFGNVILLTPKSHADRIFDQVPAFVNLEEKCAAGVSKLPNDAGLIYKVVGMEGAQVRAVRAKIREFWSIVRSEVVGACVPREFAWR